MTSPGNDLRAELWELASAACNDAMDDAGVRRLGELLANDRKAQRFYVEYCKLHATLSETLAADCAIERVVAAIDDEPLLLSEPNDDAVKVVETALPHRRVSVDVRRSATGIAVAIAFTIASLSTMHQIILPDRVVKKGAGNGESLEGTPPKVESIARLVQDIDAVWKHDRVENPQATNGGHRIKTGMKLYPGQRLHLASGLAEFKFFNGAEVVLRGPAEFEVQSIKQARLEVGALVARAHDRRAKGFVIETPTARVEDLGTEFGVVVAADGTTDSSVFRGEVELFVLDSEGTAQSSVTLTKDMAARVTAAGQLVHNLTAQPRRFGWVDAIVGPIAVKSYTYDGTPEQAQPNVGGRSYKWPDNTGGPNSELTDGVLPASANYLDVRWVGSYGPINGRHTGGPQPMVTFDLGERHRVSKIAIAYMHASGTPGAQASGSITAPERVLISTSDDGVEFTEPQEFTPFDSSPGEEIRTAKFDLEDVHGRYVRLDFRNTSYWTFLAEVAFTGSRPLESPLTEGSDSGAVNTKPLDGGKDARMISGVDRM